MDLSTLTSIYQGTVMPDHFRVLIYGKPNSGKTTLASTFPKPFFIDADKGLGTLSGDITIPNIQVTRGVKDPYALLIQVFEDMTLKRGIFGSGGMAEGTETLVVDSLSTLSDLILAQIMIANGMKPESDKPGFNEWGAFTRRMVEIASRIRDLAEKYNIVETAWANIKENEKHEIIGVTPAIPGSYKDRAAGDVDEVYYMESSKATEGGGLNIILNAIDKGFFKAKTRLLSDRKFTNATYATLLESMKKKRANATVAKK
jgi:hypothetical protein